MPTEKNVPLNYRASIDGLRAIAVLSVLIFHAFPAFLPGGFVGVDVFFVISGYLISTLLIKQFETDVFSYADFYSRRIRRIFPALILVLLSALLFAWFTLLANEYDALGKHTVASVFFVQNINLLREAGYFDYSADLKPLLHLWSLSVEEQFYILWPVVLTFCFWKKINLKGVMIFLILVSFGINETRVQKYPDSAFYEIQSRFWELMVGGLCTQIKTRARNVSGLGLVGLVMILLSLFLITSESQFPGFWALLPVLGSGLVILAGEEAWTNHTLLAWKPMVWIGLISYPLYLWHWPLLSFARILIPHLLINSRSALWIKLFCLALSFVFATFTYLAIEKPIRREGHRHHSTRKFSPALIYVTILFFSLGALGEFIHRNQGFANRYPAATQKMAPPTSNSKLSDCQHLPLIGVEWCKSNDENHPPDIVVVGDSHALALAPGIESYYRSSGRTLHFFGTGDTLGLYDVGVVMGGAPSLHGVRNLNSAFQWAIEHHAKTLILASRGPVYFEGHGFETDSRHLKLKNISDRRDILNSEIFLRGLEHTALLLSQNHIQTVFVYDNPELGFFPKEMCEERPLRIFPSAVMSPCAVPLTQVQERNKNYVASVQRVLQKFPEAQSYNPADSLCDKQFCYAIKDGLPLYLDDNHLTVSGAIYISKDFRF